eukprot:Amastigsp_a841514_22.p3 type:complete len:111 gc:universal Amastigsp_a841514_22:968-636(-)
MPDAAATPWTTVSPGRHALTALTLMGDAEPTRTTSRSAMAKQHSAAEETVHSSGRLLVSGVWSLDRRQRSGVCTLHHCTCAVPPCYTVSPSECTLQPTAFGFGTRQGTGP